MKIVVTGGTALSPAATLVIALASAVACDRRTHGNATTAALHLAEPDTGRVRSSPPRRRRPRWTSGWETPSPQSSRHRTPRNSASASKMATFTSPAAIGIPTAPPSSTNTEWSAVRRPTHGTRVGNVARSGWYVPWYATHGSTQCGDAAAAPDLRSIGDLNRYQSVFVATETGARGSRMDITPDWVTRPQERPHAFGTESQTVFAGSDGAAPARVDAANDRNKPGLTLLWEPHRTHDHHRLVRIELPQRLPKCCLAVATATTRPTPSPNGR